MKHFILGDALSVTLSLSKGRSSKPSMTQACRQVAALVLACNIFPHYRWVPSERNGADPISRRKALAHFDVEAGRRLTHHVASLPGPSSHGHALPQHYSMHPEGDPIDDSSDVKSEAIDDGLDEIPPVRPRTGPGRSECGADYSYDLLGAQGDRNQKRKGIRDTNSEIRRLLCTGRFKHSRTDNLGLGVRNVPERKVFQRKARHGRFEKQRGRGPPAENVKRGAPELPRSLQAPRGW